MKNNKYWENSLRIIFNHPIFLSDFSLFSENGVHVVLHLQIYPHTIMRHPILLSGQAGRQCSGGLDVVFVVDASGSIQDQPDGTRDPANWLALLAFVRQFIQTLAASVSDVRFAQVRWKLHSGL